MTLNERSAFEAQECVKPLLQYVGFDLQNNRYYILRNGLGESGIEWLNGGWQMWQARAKAQAVPEHINEIQSWIAVQSTQAMELDGEEFVVGANELAEFIEQLVESESGAD